MPQVSAAMEPDMVAGVRSSGPAPSYQPHEPMQHAQQPQQPLQASLGEDDEDRSHGDFCDGDVECGDDDDDGEQVSDAAAARRQAQAWLTQFACGCGCQAKVPSLLAIATSFRQQPKKDRVKFARAALFALATFPGACAPTTSTPVASPSSSAPGSTIGATAAEATEHLSAATSAANNITIHDEPPTHVLQNRRTSIKYTIKGKQVCKRAFAAIVQLSPHTLGRHIREVSSSAAFPLTESQRGKTLGRKSQHTRIIYAFLKQFVAQQERQQQGSRDSNVPPLQSSHASSKRSTPSTSASIVEGANLTLTLPSTTTKKSVYEQYRRAFPTLVQEFNRSDLQAISYPSFSRAWNKFFRCTTTAHAVSSRSSQQQHASEAASPSLPAPSPAASSQPTSQPPVKVSKRTVP